MERFILLTCILGLTRAAPRNGYTYQTPNVIQGPGGHSFTSTAVSSGVGYSSVSPGVSGVGPLVGPVVGPAPLANIPSSFGQFGGAGLPTQLYTPMVTNFLRPALHSANAQGQDIGFIQQSQQSQLGQQGQQPVIITKDIYIHSAPDEFETIGSGPIYQPQGPVRKNYKIIFIKAPAQHTQHHVAAIKAAQDSTEEKTIIYVLTKKPDIQEIHEQLQTTQTTTKLNKPEVYFIKYKTQEEAQHAQQQIQAQYEKLGGSTRVNDEGIAPVTSVIGSVSTGPQEPAIQVQNGQQSFGFGQGATTFTSGTSGPIEAPSRNYLPAKLKK